MIAVGWAADQESAGCRPRGDWREAGCGGYVRTGGAPGMGPLVYGGAATRALPGATYGSPSAVQCRTRRAPKRVHPA